MVYEMSIARKRKRLMSAADDPADFAVKKKSKLPLLLGVLLALLGGGGGFSAVKMGLIGGAHDTQADSHDSAPTPMLPVAFVPLEPLIISLPSQGTSRFLRFSAQLEVDPLYALEVETVKPRIVDVLNGYLRAVKTADLEDPTALMRLRSQMLRRIQVVVGEGRVRDLLIMEFVLN
jgi:flagellar FliL protein